MVKCYNLSLCQIAINECAILIIGGRVISRPYPNVGYRFEKFDAVFTKKSFCHQGFFAVKRRAVFILGAMWNASHLAVRLCALRHWKRVSMPPTTQSLRHPLTRAHHIAPRIKTARRFTAKNLDDNMISCKEVVSNLPNDFVW